MRKSEPRPAALQGPLGQYVRRAHPQAVPVGDERRAGGAGQVRVHQQADQALGAGGAGQGVAILGLQRGMRSAPRSPAMEHDTGRINPAGAWHRRKSLDQTAAPTRAPPPSLHQVPAPAPAHPIPMSPFPPSLPPSLPACPPARPQPYLQQARRVGGGQQGAHGALHAAIQRSAPSNLSVQLAQRGRLGLALRRSTAQRSTARHGTAQMKNGAARWGRPHSHH